MKVEKIAAFSDAGAGGNPAGVLIADNLPPEAEMRRIAAEVGFSETAFAAPWGKGWRVRYFAPGSEVPFCGHATIALGAALAKRSGDGVYPLTLNEAGITVEGASGAGSLTAALQSPPTRSRSAEPEMQAEVLKLFGLTEADLNPDLPPAHIHGSADHFMLALSSRQAVADMSHDFGAGQELMRRHGFVTILLAYAETPRLFHTRNPFASGGVYEDPATGAATAALAGYLRDIAWPHGGAIEVVQGEDMGMKSRLKADIPPAKGSSIRVSGEARVMSEAWQSPETR